MLFGSTVWFLFITRQQLAGCKALSKAVQTQLKKAKHQRCAAKQRDIKKGSHSAFQHYLEIKLTVVTRVVKCHHVLPPPNRQGRPEGFDA